MYAYTFDINSIDSSINPFDFQFLSREGKGRIRIVEDTKVI